MTMKPLDFPRLLPPAQPSLLRIQVNVEHLARTIAHLEFVFGARTWVGEVAHRDPMYAMTTFRWVYIDVEIAPAYKHLTELVGPAKWCRDYTPCALIGFGGWGIGIWCNSFWSALNALLTYAKAWWWYSQEEIGDWELTVTRYANQPPLPPPAYPRWEDERIKLRDLLPGGAWYTLMVPPKAAPQPQLKRATPPSLKPRAQEKQIPAPNVVISPRQMRLF